MMVQKQKQQQAIRKNRLKQMKAQQQ